MTEFDVVSQFHAAMMSAGISVDIADIVPDGKIHRVHVAGDAKGSKNAWYILHADEHPAGAFGCNKRLGPNGKIRWSLKETRPLTREERQAFSQKMAERKAAKEAEEKARRAAAAKRANDLWEAAQPASEHPYLARKKISAHGLRVGRWEVVNEETGAVTLVTKNALLVPLRDKKKRIHSLQAIFPNANNPLHRDKDFLRGGAKEGLFFTIGKPVSGVILICEGFATGASLHEATGHAVVVAFDAGNLAPVARSIRESFPEMSIVLCADNDQWTTTPIDNPGVYYARTAAKEIRAFVAIPPFSPKDGKTDPETGKVKGPTDFNDLALLRGHDAVRETINLALRPETPPIKTNVPLPPDPAPAQVPQPEDGVSKHDEPDGPDDTGGYFSMLGYDHERYYLFQHEKKQVLVYTKGDFTEAGLIALAPLNWWEREFPSAKEKNGIDRKSAMDWIVRCCHKAGIYDPSRLRGRGAWIDDGRVVYHHGGYLSVDGVPTAITKIKSRYVYELDRSLPEPAKSPLSDEEGARLLEIAKMFRWTKPASAALLAGWVALAPLCGALRWRPHIWLGGGPGSGKSTILNEYVHPLMAGTDMFAQGNSSEAGIRQHLKADALPVLFDESEQNDERETARVQAVLALIRQASTESEAKTFKGTAGGDALSFHIRSMFCLASVQVGMKHQADIERMAVLNLRPKREDKDAAETWKRIKDALYAIKRDPEIGRRLLRRSLDLLPVTRANIDLFAEVAAQRFGSQRDGDQYGTLLAGAWSLISTQLATREEVEQMIDQYDWSEHLENADLDDSVRAYASLMEAHVKLQGGVIVTVYELCRMALGYEVEGVQMQASSADAVLQRYGMRVRDGRLLVSNTSDQPKHLMQGTPFSADLRGVLLRYPGADRYGDRTQRFNGQTSKCISLPLNMDDAQPAPSGSPYDGYDPEDTVSF
jgi:Uncharacterized protein conserved in bacteria